MDTFEAILTVLSSGKKTSFEIATELGLAPAKVTALLATLVSRRGVEKVGKIRSSGKDVVIYAATNLVSYEAHAPDQPSQTNSDFEIASRLYQRWGGYVSVDSRPSKRHLTLKHKLE
jgi:hypothetical protein